MISSFFIGLGLLILLVSLRIGSDPVPDLLAWELIGMATLASLVICYFLIWWPSAAWLRRIRYEITDHEIIVNVGLITRSKKIVPFRTITNLGIKRGPLDRMFGIGTVEIQTAGDSGSDTSSCGPEQKLIGVKDVDATAKHIRMAIRRFYGTAGVSIEKELPSSQLLLQKILEELKLLRGDA